VRRQTYAAVVGATTSERFCVKSEPKGSVENADAREIWERACRSRAVHGRQRLVRHRATCERRTKGEVDV
jgi:hypothetical protein